LNYRIILSVIGFLGILWGFSGIPDLYKRYKVDIDVQFHNINEEEKRHLIISNLGNFPLEILEKTTVEVATNKRNEALQNLRVVGKDTYGILNPNDISIRNGKICIGIKVKADFIKLIDNNLFTKTMSNRIIYPLKSSSKIPILKNLEKEKLEIVDFVFCIKLYCKQIFPDDFVGKVHKFISVVFGEDENIPLKRYFKYSSGDHIVIKEISEEKAYNATINYSNGRIML
jgi:hypothetical protein